MTGLMIWPLGPSAPPSAPAWMEEELEETGETPAAEVGDALPVLSWLIDRPADPDGEAW